MASPQKIEPDDVPRWGSRTWFIFFVCAFIMVMIVACAGPKEGVVVDRDHDPAWQSWTNGTQQCSGTGSSRSCWTTPGHWTYYDDSWELRLNDGKGEEGWREVGEQAFNDCLVGERYPECAS